MMEIQDELAEIESLDSGKPLACEYSETWTILSWIMNHVEGLKADS